MAYNKSGKPWRCPSPETQDTLLRENPIRTVERVAVLSAGFKGLHSSFDDA